MTNNELIQIVLDKLDKLENKLDNLQSMLSTNQVQISSLEQRVAHLIQWKEEATRKAGATTAWIVTNLVFLVVYLLEKLVF